MTFFSDLSSVWQQTCLDFVSEPSEELSLEIASPSYSETLGRLTRLLEHDIVKIGTVRCILDASSSSADETETARETVTTTARSAVQTFGCMAHVLRDIAKHSGNVKCVVDILKSAGDALVEAILALDSRVSQQLGSGTPVVSVGPKISQLVARVIYCLKNLSKVPTTFLEATEFHVAEVLTLLNDTALELVELDLTGDSEEGPGSEASFHAREDEDGDDFATRASSGDDVNAASTGVPDEEEEVEKEQRRRVHAAFLGTVQSLIFLVEEMLAVTRQSLSTKCATGDRRRFVLVDKVLAQMLTLSHHVDACCSKMYDHQLSEALEETKCLESVCSMELAPALAQVLEGRHFEALLSRLNSALHRAQSNLCTLKGAMSVSAGETSG